MYRRSRPSCNACVLHTSGSESPTHFGHEEYSSNSNIRATISINWCEYLSSNCILNCFLYLFEREWGTRAIAGRSHADAAADAAAASMIDTTPGREGAAPAEGLTERCEDVAAARRRRLLPIRCYTHLHGKLPVFPFVSPGPSACNP